MQDESSNYLTFNNDIGSTINQNVAFSVGEIVDVTFRDEHNPLEVDGSRDMALQDAYRGGSNQGFDITFHPSNWLSAYLAFGEIKSFDATAISSPTTIKPQTGSGDPSQIWLVKDLTNAIEPVATDSVYLSTDGNTYADSNLTVKGWDDTNKLLYVSSDTVASTPKVGDYLKEGSGNITAFTQDTSSINVTFANVDGAGDTITFASDPSHPFEANDFIVISGSSSNNGTFQIASKTTTVLTLVDDEDNVLTNETMTTGTLSITELSQDAAWVLQIVGFVHTLKRSPTLPYFSGMGITEEDTTLDYAGCHVATYSLTYTQAGLMQCSMTGEALTLDNDNLKSAINGSNPITIASGITGNTGSNFLENGIYVPCTAGRKVGTGTAKLFRFESEDTTNRPVKIMITTNQDTSGSGAADGFGTNVSGIPDSNPFANGSDWVPYTRSIEMGFSNEFERGPINNDGDANYFLKGNHENSLVLNVDLPNESSVSGSGTAHRNVATMRTMVKKFGLVSADIQFGLDDGQALLVHYRNLKLFGLPRSFENSIRMSLGFFVLEQPEMTVIDDAYKWVVLT